MIQYESDNSPFFVENKNYCENISSKLMRIDQNCFGFCNSFGYDIETTLTKNNLTYKIKFHKHQSTQDGIIFPVDAKNYAWTEISVTGLNTKNSLTVGKSSFKRLLISKKFKNKFPTPYFIKLNYIPEDTLFDDLVKKIVFYKISKLKLHKGKLAYIIHLPITDPFELITDIDMIIKNWE